MGEFLKNLESVFRGRVKDLLIKRIKKEGRIFIGDTTLRDGEQAPGAGLGVADKLKIAKQLDTLGVDSIEAGFPISSKEEFEAVKLIAENVHRPVITALCRSRKEDIDCAREALKNAHKWGFGIFLGTSPILRKYSLGKTKEEVIQIIKETISYAKKYSDNIAFGAEDASRTEPDFLYRAYEEAIKAGAMVVGFPDTVGCLIPEEVKDIIENIKLNVRNLDKAFLAVHFHDDLGLAVANALAAIKSGVNIIQCTVNGIGERAGNTSLEEIVMALQAKQSYYKARIGVNTKELYKTSRLVSQLTGLSISANKSIVGENVFATEAGIHQAALLKKRVTYEIIKPQDVGQEGTRIVLGKHSGKHALTDRLNKLGYRISEKDNRLDTIYDKFKEAAVNRKEIGDTE